jgi:hypothetical protein
MKTGTKNGMHFWVPKHSRENLILLLMPNLMHIKPKVSEINLNLSN